MKFLVDENLSESDKFLKGHLEFVNVKHLMKPGEADDEIIEKALVHDFMIVTKDIKLALNSLIRGVRVWYYDAEKIPNTS
jgi:predicted nuclease of predicted toxin-antitoxin system